MKLFCPYCTKEIDQKTIQCPFCGTTYESETIQLLSELVKVADEEEVGANRRKFDRVPRKFKIVYSTPKAFVEHYLANISQGGIFIPTSTSLEPGTQFNLKITLPDGREELEVLGEVVWARKEEEVTQKGKYIPGMGVKFLNLSEEGRARIDTICKQVRAEIDKLLGKK